MEKLKGFKAKANEFAASSKSRIDSAGKKVPFTGKKEDDEPKQARYFATINVKDVSTFEPPPKRVGNIPGARPEDRDKGPSVSSARPTLPARRESAASTTTTGSNDARPPPLPARSSSNASETLARSNSPRKPSTPTKPVVAAKPMSPGIPPKRASITVPGPSQTEASPSLPTRTSSYGQLRNTFGTAVDSTQVKELKNSLNKTTSRESSTSPSASRVNMQDVSTASGIAQKYRKDPNSLSLSDAKAGLKVANKVLPPSTDTSPPNTQDLQTASNLGQKWNKDPKSLGLSDLKAGYAVANKFRPQPTADVDEAPATSPEKSSVNDLKSRFANVSLGGMKPPPTKTPTSPPQSPSPTKKIPPPPPPKPRLANGGPKSPTSTSSQPSFNLATKPSRPSSMPSQSWTPRDIPLNFETKWYCSEPMQQIPYLTSNPNKAVSTSTITASGSGTASHMTWIYTATFAIRWTSDLSRTFIRVTWSSDDPVRSVHGQQKHFPPPQFLSPTDLERCTELYGASVVAFCQSQIGRQVGNGECWTLAHDALEFVQQSGIQPKVMGCCGTIHGHIIYRRDPIEFGNLENVREGDIVQYLECKFERRQGGRVVYSSSAGAPDHTSVVVGKRGNVIDVLHQNVGGVRKVQKGELILDEMVSGKIWIYRPVWESWAGTLEPKWENSW